MLRIRSGKNETCKFQVQIRSESMRVGYFGELDARAKEMEDKKVQLEALYMMPKDDSEIAADDLSKGQFEKLFQETDALLPSYASTIKTVKLAIEAQLKKNLKSTCFQNQLSSKYMMIKTTTPAATLRTLQRQKQRRSPRVLPKSEI